MLRWRFNLNTLERLSVVKQTEDKKIIKSFINSENTRDDGFSYNVWRCSYRSCLVFGSKNVSNWIKKQAEAGARQALFDHEPKTDRIHWLKFDFIWLNHFVINWLLDRPSNMNNLHTSRHKALWSCGSRVGSIIHNFVLLFTHSLSFVLIFSNAFQQFSFYWFHI